MKFKFKIVASELIEEMDTKSNSQVLLRCCKYLETKVPKEGDSLSLS